MKFIIIPFILFYMSLFSQLPDTTPSKVRINKKIFANIDFSSRGTGLLITRFKRKNYKNFKSLNFSISFLNHPKEIKITNFRLQRRVPYKINHIFQIQLHKGNEKLWIDHPTPEKGIKIYRNYNIGPNLIIQKPRYIAYGFSYVHRKVLYNPSIHPNPFWVHDLDGYFMSGFKEAILIPGIGGEYSIIFERYNKDKQVHRLSVGTNIQYYFKPIIILYTLKEKLIPTAFIRFSIGRVKRGM